MYTANGQSVAALVMGGRTSWATQIPSSCSYTALARGARHHRAFAIFCLIRSDWEKRAWTRYANCSLTLSLCSARRKANGRFAWGTVPLSRCRLRIVRSASIASQSRRARGTVPSAGGNPSELSRAEPSPGGYCRLNSPPKYFSSVGVMIPVAVTHTECSFPSNLDSQKHKNLLSTGNRGARSYSCHIKDWRSAG
jgi:hypothetical protein